MNDVDLRTQIFENLYHRRVAAGVGVGAVEVATLARELGASAVRVAVICNDLARHGHVDAERDGNMMGFVRLSDAGVAYHDEVMEMSS
jgi:Mn-dependent DtxR family transcriptional regulator